MSRSLVKELEAAYDANPPRELIVRVRYRKERRSNLSAGGASAASVSSSTGKAARGEVSNSSRGADSSPASGASTSGAAGASSLSAPRRRRQQPTPNANNRRPSLPSSDKSPSKTSTSKSAVEAEKDKGEVGKEKGGAGAAGRRLARKTAEQEKETPAAAAAAKNDDDNASAAVEKDSNDSNSSSSKKKPLAVPASATARLKVSPAMKRRIASGDTAAASAAAPAAAPAVDENARNMWSFPDPSSVSFVQFVWLQEEGKIKRKWESLLSSDPIPFADPPSASSSSSSKPPVVPQDADAPPVPDAPVDLNSSSEDEENEPGVLDKESSLAPVVPKSPKAPLISGDSPSADPTSSAQSSSAPSSLISASGKKKIGNEKAATLDHLLRLHSSKQYDEVKQLLPALDKPMRDLFRQSVLALRPGNASNSNGAAGGGGGGGAAGGPRNSPKLVSYGCGRRDRPSSTSTPSTATAAVPATTTTTTKTRVTERGRVVAIAQSNEDDECDDISDSPLVELHIHVPIHDADDDGSYTKKIFVVTSSTSRDELLKTVWNVFVKLAGSASSAAVSQLKNGKHDLEVFVDGSMVGSLLQDSLHPLKWLRRLAKKHAGSKLAELEVKFKLGD